MLADTLVEVRPVVIVKFVVIFDHGEQVGKVVLTLGEPFGLGRKIDPVPFGNRASQPAGLVLTLVERGEVGIARMAELEHPIEHGERASTKLFALRLANLGLGDMVEKAGQILKVCQFA